MIPLLTSKATIAYSKESLIPILRQEQTEAEG